MPPYWNAEGLPIGVHFLAPFQPREFVEALRALMLGIEYYVIDPEDEYRRVCDAVGGQYIRLSAPTPSPRQEASNAP